MANFYHCGSIGSNADQSELDKKVNKTGDTLTGSLLIERQNENAGFIVNGKANSVGLYGTDNGAIIYDNTKQRTVLYINNDTVPHLNGSADYASKDINGNQINETYLSNASIATGFNASQVLLGVNEYIGKSSEPSVNKGMSIIPSATTSNAGVMSASDKQVINYISTIDFTPYVVTASGYVGNSAEDSTFNLMGYITAIVISKLVILSFVVRCSTYSSQMNSFKCGINRDMLRNSFGFPNIQPLPGGICTYNRSALTGYGGLVNCNGQFWTFGRMYNEDGSIGDWGSQSFDVGTIITGTAYGKLI